MIVYSICYIYFIRQVCKAAFCLLWRMSVIGPVRIRYPALVLYQSIIRPFVNIMIIWDSYMCS